MDLRADRRAEAESSLGVATVSSLEEAWAYQADVAVIALPTSLHIPVATEAAGHGCHLFIEKPLGDRMEGTEELATIVKKNHLTSLVGCNIRYHHGPAIIKELIEKNAVGKVMSVGIDAGQYLPDWHPWEDYREMYSAKSSLGGGVILDGIHEIDYARWMFGEVSEVYAQGGKLSSMEIDTEDSVNILMRMAAGFTVSIHMDYIQRHYWRTCKVIGEEGTIYWDISQGTVRLYTAASGQWESFDQPEDYNINQMYLDEMQHFFRCLDGSETSAMDIGEARRVLEITLAVKESMLSGLPVGTA
jgi:predicted dehydrogenase